MQNLRIETNEGAPQKNRLRRLNFLQRQQQVFERAGQPIQLEHHHHIARFQVFYQPLQLKPIPTPTGGLLLKDAFTPALCKAVRSRCT